MKRRTVLARVVGSAVTGSVGGFAAAEAGAPSYRARSTAPARRAEVAGSATPVPRVDTRHAALLVMDYQLAWLRTLAESDRLLARAAGAIAAARAAGLHVAYARVGFTPADSAAVPEGNVIFTQIASEPGALAEGSPAMAIDDRVAPETGDKVVRKTRVSAFQRTDLDGWLRAMGVDTLILAGISTSGVVLSTVCDGADLDYRLIVLADACADRDPDIQDVLIHNVFPQRALVITVAELPELLGSAT